jgi:hypothetical protein
MKIIDKTPLQDANGNINWAARVQGTLKYGLNWFGELEAQKLVIAQLDRLLEKGFVLIRNFTLPNSEIVIPIILIGAGGIWVIYVTKEKGNFEAKGDQWNTVSNDGRSLPASINFIDRSLKLSNAFQKYLKIQKVEMPNPVEAVLIAADPGAQIESVRPIVRVVRSDAIKQFASTLLQARPIWRPEIVHGLADRIFDPRPPQALAPVAPTPAPQQSAPRSGVAAEAADQENPFDANELGFAFEEGSPSAPQNSNQSNQARPQSELKSAPAKNKFFGLKDTQIVLLVGMFIVECCIIFGFGIILYLNP